MSSNPSGTAASRKPRSAEFTLFAGLVFLLAAVCVAHFARPDWTGAIVAVLYVIGACLVFVAGGMMEAEIRKML